MAHLFIISAPSGSGKTTLVQELFQRVEGLRFSISYTTRAPRGSEENGREYFFVDRPTFTRMVAAGEFLEHAEVFGHGYGTSWAFLEQARAAGQDLVLDIDVQGARQVRQRFPEALSIFIAPPDRDTLAYRLRNRGLDAPGVVETRLADASREISAYNDYDYVVINDRIATSVDELVAIVECERGRQRPEPPPEKYCALAETCRRATAGRRLLPVLASFGLPQAQIQE